MGISAEIQHRKKIKMIKLELEVNEVNVILAVLGKHPFEEVANLIVKIKNQGDPQAEHASVPAGWYLLQSQCEGTGRRGSGQAAPGCT